MGKYDAERAKLRGGTASPSPAAQPVQSASKYARERQAIVSGPEEPLAEQVGKYQPMLDDLSAPEAADNWPRFRTDLPGGWINPANAINAFRNSPVGTTVDRFAQAAGRTMGLNDSQMSPKAETGNSIVDGAADIAGSVAGYFVNPGQLSQGVGSVYRAAAPYAERIGGKLAERLLPDAGLTINKAGNVADSLATRVVKEGLQEGMTGAAYGVNRELMQGENDLGEIIQGGLIEGGLGLATGGVMPVLGAGLRVAREGIADAAGRLRPEAPLRTPDYGNIGFDRSTTLDPMGTAGRKTVQGYGHADFAKRTEFMNRQLGVERPLGLPAPAREPFPPRDERIRASQERSVNEYGAEPIVNEHTFALPEPSPERVAQYKNITDAQDALKKIDTRIKQNQTRLSSNPDNVKLQQSIDSLTRVRDDIQRSIDEFNQVKRGEVGEGLKREVVGVTPQPQPKPIQTPQKPVQAPNEVVQGKAITETPKTPTVPKQEPQTAERGMITKMKESPNTSEALKEEIKQIPAEKTEIKRKYNSDTFNKALKMIEKEGREESFSRIMASKKLTDDNAFVAQALIKLYEQEGTKEAFSRATDLINKIAPQGTEVARALQALTAWNRLDTTEGVLMLGRRQLNRNAKEAVDLTTEQVTDLSQKAQNFKAKTEVQNLADEVAEIVERRADGSALTDAEKSKIREFQKQVEKVAGKESKAKPEAKQPPKNPEKLPVQYRTRDAVNDYMSYQAEQAMARINARKNRLSANPVDEWKDYAIVGAAKLAQGTIKFADWSEAMLKEVGKGIKPHLQDIYNRSYDRYKRANRIEPEEVRRVTEKALKENTLSIEDAEVFRQMARKLREMNGQAYIEAAQDLQKALSDLYNPTFLDKVSSAQAIAQLLNPKTMTRNIGGNEMFHMVEKFKKLISVPIDWSASKFTGKRSVVWLADNPEQMFSDFMNGFVRYGKNWKDGFQSGARGVNPGGRVTQFDIRPNSFRSKANPLFYLERALGASMQSFDNAAYMRAYENKLRELAKANKMNQRLPLDDLIRNADENMKEIADAYGRYMTFQDDNALSAVAVFVKKSLNNPLYFYNKKEIGWGLGDIVLKYAKTPANLLMRAIDYSPLGAMRSLNELVQARKGNFNQERFVESLSRAIVGTGGFSMMGYFLADLGILSGSSDKDIDVRELEKTAGESQYQVNTTALGRALEAFFTKKGVKGMAEAAKKQKGDTLINYDWAMPLSVALSMGANAEKQVNEPGKKPVTPLTPYPLVNSAVNVMKSGFDAVTGAASSIVEQPLVQGIKEVTQFYPGETVGDKVRKIATDVPASFIPTASNQGKQLTDNASRLTYSPNPFTEAMNKVVNRVPGLSKDLPQQYDTLGKPKEVYQDGTNSVMNVLFNPAFVSKYNPTPEAERVLDIINETGDKTVAPRYQKKSITVKGETYRLTPEQFQQMQKIAGEETARGLQRLNPNMRTDTMQKAINNVLTKAGQKAKASVEREVTGR